MAKDYEVEALAVDLKAFAQHMIGVQVVGEFWDQLDDWKVHLLKLVDAQEHATNAQLKLLNSEVTRIAKEDAERAQAAFGLGLMALSLVTGPIASFVAGKIENVWFPKLASSVRERFDLVSIVKGTPKDPVLLMGFTENNWNKVHAKVFGDLGGAVTGLGINGAIQVAAPNVQAAAPAIALARSSDSMGSFKTNLGVAFVEQAKVTRGAILKLAGSIANNPNWGFECLEKLYQKYQGHVNAARSEKATLQNFAYKMIREDIDRVRQQWANDWFFYGRTPPVLSIPDLREALEIEQWALWILEDGVSVEVEHTQPGGHPGKGPLSRKRTYYTSQTFGDKPLPEAVLRKLADFGVLEARDAAQRRLKLQRETERHAERKRKRDAELKRLYPDENDRLKKVYEHISEDEKADEEERKQRPNIDIGDKLDTEGEMDALEAWAKNHPPVLSNGQLSSTKRMLRPIEEIVKSGKYTL